MKINIVIQSTSGAAFEEDYHAEVARILSTVEVIRLNDPSAYQYLRDINGNKCGFVEVAAE